MVIHNLCRVFYCFSLFSKYFLWLNVYHKNNVCEYLPLSFNENVWVFLLEMFHFFNFYKSNSIHSVNLKSWIWYFYTNFSILYFICYAIFKIILGFYYFGLKRPRLHSMSVKKDPPPKKKKNINKNPELENKQWPIHW